MIAHAVDRQKPLLRRCIDDIAPRTHAERVDAPPVRKPVCQLVRCGRHLIRASRPVERPVNHSLRMLNPESDGERLRRHAQACIIQHPEGIARGVSDRQHKYICHQMGLQGLRFLVRLLPLCHNLPDLPLSAASGFPCRPHTDQLFREADLPAAGDDFIPDVSNRFSQHIGSDVRLIGIQNLRIGTCLHKGLQHKPDPPEGILHPCIELSV